MGLRKNKEKRRRAAAFTALLLLLTLLFSACGGNAPGGVSSGNGEGDSAAVSKDPSDPSGSGDVTSELPADPPEEIPPLPQSGALSLLSWGSSYLPASFDGVNPRILEGGRLALVFAGATEERGLELAEGCELSYTLTDKSGAVTEEGTAALDTEGVEGLKGAGGYKGVAFAVKKEWKRAETGCLSLTFQDLKGVEFKVEKAEIYKGLQYLGVTPSLLDLSDIGVKTVFGKELITMTGRFYSTDFKFVLRLNRWAEKTKPEQIAHCARLFFDCYPKMYDRFGKRFGSPVKVTLAIENEGYEIASTGGDQVHIHDQWLKDHKTDYDCLTHEFAHVIQNGWDGEYCQYSGFIERFADYCRYVYAYKDGYYNDPDWVLNTVEGEKELENSVRFLVYLDRFHSTKENDLIVNYFDVIFHKKYPAKQWDKAWAEIFKGSDLEGMTGEQAFAMYKKDAFSTVSAKAARRGGVSPLLKEYNARQILRTRQF